MALQSLRSALNRGTDEPVSSPARAMPAAPLASGGSDVVVFGCPACGRTIAKGSRRCQGCGQRLILDVPSSKAATFAGAGLLAGLVVGAILVGLTMPREAASGTASGGGPASAAPARAPVGANAAAALRGTTILNGRLAAQADPLSAALNAKTLPVQDVVKILRQMSIDNRAAAAMVKSLSGWPEAADQARRLAAFYDELGSEINEGLTASVESDGAYKATTKRIMATLSEIVGLDTAARTLASGADFELPAVALPPVLR